MSERVAVFIDGGYLERIGKDEFPGITIDFSKLSDKMAFGFPHLRTYYYNCLPYQSNPATADEKSRFANKQRFYHALEGLNHFNVRLGKLKYRGLDSSGNPIFEQKGVDVYLATDLVLLSTKHLITHASLLTADTDFLPAFKVAQDEGVVIKLYHSAKMGNANDLWQCADERVVIDSNFMQNIKSS